MTGSGRSRLVKADPVVGRMATCLGANADKACPVGRGYGNVIWPGAQEDANEHVSRKIWLGGVPESKLALHSGLRRWPCIGNVSDMGRAACFFNFKTATIYRHLVETRKNKNDLRVLPAGSFRQRTGT